MIHVGDCVEVMARMRAASVDAIVCDPPYGLEFMGRDWDKLGGDARMSATGLGDRPVDWPSFGGSPHGGANPTCATCGGRARGTTRCRCGEPDWRVNGRESAAGSATAGQAMQGWHERWVREALRVLKPGGHLLAFGGTRTYHRLACGIEDAGFEVRDSMLAWGYGSGFPKSLDVSKAIDKAAGAEREDAGERVYAGGHVQRASDDRLDPPIGTFAGKGSPRDSVAATDDAARWAGWGTALKPAFEPVVVARKPLSGTVVETVLTHGTGALNIDACRVAAVGGSPAAGRRQGSTAHLSDGDSRHGDRAEGRIVNYTTPERYQEVRPGELLGRWPANVVLIHGEGCVRVGERRVKGIGGGDRTTALGLLNDDGWKPEPQERVGYGDADGFETVEAWECVDGCPVAELDAMAPDAGGGGFPGEKGGIGQGQVYGTPGTGEGLRDTGRIDANGGASRFYYSAKAARGEREVGLRGRVPCARCGELDTTDHVVDEIAGPCIRNNHPTVKPVAVMRWLVRLVTPPGGLVLDPFTGSGTTGVAAGLEGFRFVGVEQDERSALIAETRIAYWGEHGEHVDAVERREAERFLDDGSEQLGLLG